MTDERWEKVVAIFEAAVDRPDAERASYIHRACGDDEALIREVESLLAQDRRVGPLEDSLWPPPPPIDVPPRLATGARLGGYRIDALVGTGGMGEVYRAQDSALRRTVALKVLPAALTADRERESRFRREAQVLAALHHPNIAGIYGLDTSTDVHALVLEFVDGDTLAERLSRGPLPLDEALHIAGQIAEALEAAHEQAIVHRDLKPANIKITPDGVVKVLDFGLARLAQSVEAAASASDDTSKSPTLTSPVASAAGLILGTAAYMSPEQAKGRVADKRSDVWAFGCVVYEMLTTRRAFEGDGVAETLAAVLRAEPDWQALPADLPAAVERLLRGCLTKERKQRIADLSAARFALAMPPSEPRVTLAAVPSSRWRLAAVAIAIAVVAAGAMAIGRWQGAAAQRPGSVVRFSIPLPEGVSFGASGQRLVGISPDGSRIAYADRTRFYVQTLADGISRPVPGTEGVNGSPVFTDDGETLIYFAQTLSTRDDSRFRLLDNGALKSVRLDGSSPVTICPDVSYALGLSVHGDVLYFGQFSKGVMRVPLSGGTPASVVAIREDEAALRPQLLPDNRHVLFTLAQGYQDVSQYGPVDDLADVTDRMWLNAKVVVQSLDNGERTTILEGASAALYVPTGHLLVSNGGVLRAAPFDLTGLKLRTEPVLVLEGVARTRRSLIPTGSSHYAVSSNGTLVYIAGAPYSTETDAVRDLAVLGGQTRPQRLGLTRASYLGPRVSADKTRLAVTVDDGQRANIWIREVSGQRPERRLTSGGHNRSPVWSPDGTRVAFQSDRDGDAAIFVQPVDGGAAATRLTTPEKGARHEPFSWAGHVLLFSEETAAGFALKTIDTTSGAVQPFGNVTSKTINPAAEFSPDGKWVAYQTGQVPSPELLVQPFPANGVPIPLPVPGRHPRWSPDGTRLFFTSGPEVRVATIGYHPFRIEQMATFMLSQDGVTFGPMRPNYDVIDSERLIAPVTAAGGFPVSVTSTRQMEVVLNWFEDLKQRAPIR